MKNGMDGKATMRREGKPGKRDWGGGVGDGGQRLKTNSNTLTEHFPTACVPFPFRLFFYLNFLLSRGFAVLRLKQTKQKKQPTNKQL